MAITVLEIVAHVGRRLDIPRDVLLGNDRHQKYVKVRHAIMLVARVRLGLSYLIIGRRLGGRDHSTVINGVERCLERLTDKRCPLTLRTYKIAVRYVVTQRRAKAVGLSDDVEGSIDA
jgi:chromosomal replication initiation ATPase DnaA